jgi:putative ABC transport system ATP-binding protein
VISTGDNAIVARCRGVTKTYGTGLTQVMALRGVDLEVYQGELLMIVGPSGCGKTTLISIISAIIKQDEGQCEVLGHDLLSLGIKEKELLRGKSIGFVFQIFNLMPALTALENIAVPLLINRVPRKSAMKQAVSVLESVGLESRADAFPGQMSGGQQQRVAIARALVHSPKLVVCDEPTSNLDHKTGHEIITVLRGMAQKKDRSVIIVTHDNRILEFADRVARMDDGRIVEIGTGHKKGGQLV